jgi:hypothetical protein
MNDRTRHRRVLQLEALEDRVAPSGGPGTASSYHPTGAGRGGAELQILQDRGRARSVSRSWPGAGSTPASAGFNRALVNLDRAPRRFDTVGPRGQEAALRGFNRAIAGVLRAETQLNQAFVASPTDCKKRIGLACNAPWTTSSASMIGSSRSWSGPRPRGSRARPRPMGRGRLRR